MRYRNIINAIQNQSDHLLTIELIEALADSSDVNVTFVGSEQQELQRIKANLKKNALANSEINCDTVVTPGSLVKKVVVEQAKNKHADLLVIDNKDHHLTKKVTRSLLKTSPCDVLIVNAENSN